MTAEPVCIELWSMHQAKYNLVLTLKCEAQKAEWLDISVVSAL